MKKLRFALNIAMGVCISAAAVLSFVIGVRSFSVDGADVFFALAQALAAIVAWYLAHNAVHELFHAIGVSLFFGKVLSVSFWGFELSLVKGEKRIVFSPSSAYAGSVEFVCLRPEKADITLSASLYGGLVGSLLTIAACPVTYLLAPSEFTYFFCLMGVFSPLYMFYVNFFGGRDTSDGNLLFCKRRGDNAFTVAARRLETEGRLFKGFDLCDSYPERMNELFGESEEPDEYDYLRALRMGDGALAGELAERLSSNDKMRDNGVIDPFFEKLFIACAVDGAGYEAYAAAVAAAFERSDVNSLRVHCAYRYALGETEWAELLKKSYFKACDGIRVEGLKKAYIEIGNIWLK